VVELPSEAVVIDLTPTLDARELVELGELEASDLG
jgi:hypothetical protein